jgi:phosphonoacetate hydrolase
VDPTSFVVNGRTYVVPAAPVVVICIDGSEPDYHVAAVEAGRLPWLRGMRGCPARVEVAFGVAA